MRTCPNCNAQVAVLICNLSNNTYFCHNCAETACPTFLPGLIYTLDDVKFLRDCGINPEVGKIEGHLKDLTKHCKRSNGTDRAWFRTRAEAVAFAQDPKNPTYLGDISSLCARCDLYHLNRPEWLEPVLTHQDAALLESMCIDAPAKTPGNLKCGQCGVAFRTGIDFLILPDGNMVCGTGCSSQYE